MGILGKLAFKTAIDIAVKTGAMEKVSNTVGSKLNRITKTKEVEEILADTSFNYNMALEYEQRGDYNWLYSVFDENRKEKYKIKKRSLNSKRVNLLDGKNNLIGYVKRKKLIIESPLEKDLRVCEIVLGDEPLCEIRTYYNLKENVVETDYKNIKLKSNIYQTKFDIYDKDNVLVCQIYRPFAEAKYKERYILLYDDKKLEKVFLLFALALEKLSFDD